MGASAAPRLEAHSSCLILARPPSCNFSPSRFQRDNSVARSSKRDEEASRALEAPSRQQPLSSSISSSSGFFQEVKLTGCMRGGGRSAERGSPRPIAAASGEVRGLVEAAISDPSPPLARSCPSLKVKRKSEAAASAKAAVAAAAAATAVAIRKGKDSNASISNSIKQQQQKQQQQKQQQQQQQQWARRVGVRWAAAPSSDPSPAAVAARREQQLQQQLSA
ncbi:hypothetical protein Emag_006212 [Eimeria magna]